MAKKVLSKLFFYPVRVEPLATARASPFFITVYFCRFRLSLSCEIGRNDFKYTNISGLTSGKDNFFSGLMLKHNG